MMIVKSIAGMMGFLMAVAGAYGQAVNGRGGVTVSEDAAYFTLSNGTITAKVLKRNGDLASLQCKGVEARTGKSGHAGAYWSHDASGGKELITKVTVDPKTNGGERAEVSVKGSSGGKKMGHPAGGAADRDFPVDIDIR